MTNAVCVSSPCLSIWKPTKSASDTDHLNSYNSLESHDVFSLIIELFIQAIWRHKIIWFKWCSVRSLPIVTITGIHRVHKHKKWTHWLFDFCLGRVNLQSSQVIRLFHWSHLFVLFWKNKVRSLNGISRVQSAPCYFSPVLEIGQVILPNATTPQCIPGGCICMFTPPELPNLRPVPLSILGVTLWVLLVGAFNPIENISQVRSFPQAERENEKKHEITT